MVKTYTIESTDHRAHMSEHQDGQWVRQADYDAEWQKQEKSIVQKITRIRELEAALGEIIEACDSRVSTWILSRIKAIAIVHLPAETKCPDCGVHYVKGARHFSECSSQPSATVETSGVKP